MAEPHADELLDKAMTAEDGQANELAGGLEQVQELLFGAQARAFEQRLSALAERQTSDLRALAHALEGQFERQREHVASELAAQEERLSLERRDRAAVLSDLRRELRESLREAERRLQALEEATTAAQRELRQQIYEQGEQVRDELRRVREELVAATASEVAGLRDTKADRLLLARLLVEVAAGLEAPRAEEEGHALH